MAQYRDFVEQYMAELQELTFNSKPIITTLTILAAENLGAASSVVAAIERHLSSVVRTPELLLSQCSNFFLQSRVQAAQYVRPLNTCSSLQPVSTVHCCLLSRVG